MEALIARELALGASSSAGAPKKRRAADADAVPRGGGKQKKQRVGEA